MLSVAITGVGVVAATGTRVTDLWAAFGAGVKRARLESPSDLSAHLTEAQLQTFDRASRLAVVAANLAFDDAGRPSYAEPLLGVSLGNTYGCLGAQIELDRVILKEGPQAVSGSLFPYAAFNAAAANIAIARRAKGPNFTLGTGGAAGMDACAEGARQIQDGSAGAMLAGGVEAVGPDLYSWLDKLGVQTPPGEGAAIVMLESSEAAVRRGARLHGHIVAAADRVADDGSRASLIRASTACARSALQEAGLAAADIRWVIGESAWLTDAFDGRTVPTRSVESTLGDTLSASGAFHVVLALLSLQHPTDSGPVLCLSRSLEGIVSGLVITS
jgi:3-oxoacyl-[acyl-carrier-protein] synthase II